MTMDLEIFKAMYLLGLASYLTCQFAVLLLVLYMEKSTRSKDVKNALANSRDLAKSNLLWSPLWPLKLILGIPGMYRLLRE
jgi:hypothetical protein